MKNLIGTCILLTCVSACGGRKESPEEIYAQVAVDAEAQYDLAMKNAAPNVEKCALSQVTQQAFLQAKNEERYKEFLLISRLWCKLAPMMERIDGAK